MEMDESGRLRKSVHIREVIREVRKNFTFSQTREGINYFNVPCAFDIETTSFYRTNENGEHEKCAVMYVWAFGIWGRVVYGRTWEEFVTMMNEIKDELTLDDTHRLMIYVHNLAYDFQFFRKWITIEKVFALKPRKPIYVTGEGVEFRCSYILSNSKLADVADGLVYHKLKKMIGDLDYALMRHSATLLTDEELNYISHDVMIVMAYIDECMGRENKRICAIPLTQTGYVRRHARNMCFYDEDDKYKRRRYREMIKTLELSMEEYEQLKRAFQGGFTHANAFLSGKTVENVTSYDFASCYPAQMIAEQYPMSAPELVEIRSEKDFRYCCENYCCVFEATFYELSPKIWNEHYISYTHCRSIKNVVVDNGRVVSADRLTITLTEQDFFIIEDFYDYKGMEIEQLRRMRKSWLPKDMIKCVLELYGDKTKLKSVEGEEERYMRAKEMLNALYGMCVTKPLQDEIEYTDEWLELTPLELAEAEKRLKRYNANPNRFLFYAWGVWVTAYARRKLFTAIKECGTDYVYSDTDSVKVRNAHLHTDYFKDYNERITAKIHDALEANGFGAELASPCNKKGEKKPLGIWDCEGTYRRFKTLGAKRYIYEDAGGDMHLTISGVDKAKGMEYLLRKYGNADTVFKEFSDGLVFPKGETGKMTHTYVDYAIQGTMKDYKGNECEYYEKSFIHLEDAEYSLSLSQEYLDFLYALEVDLI